MTDKERIEKLFRSSQGRLINLWEIVNGLRIIEYSGRISDVRKDWKCTCGKDQKTCVAREHIINVKTNWYKYVSNIPQTLKIVDKSTDVKTRISELKTELEQLREDYRALRGTKQALEIEKDGRLKKALLSLLENSVEKSQLVQDVQEALL